MTKSSLDSNFYIDKITRVGVESTFHINDTNTPHLPFSHFLANQNEWICKSEVISYVYYEEFL